MQRTEALNAFIADIYGERRILGEGLIPADVVLNNPQLCISANGVVPPHGIHAHICGIDIVRTGADDFFVLEDNARTRSGVSYMVENREAMLRLCPELFRAFSVEPVDSYADALAAMMTSVAPLGRESNSTCNAPGTGIANDKVIYGSMFETVRSDCDAEPLLLYVRTFRFHEPDALAHAFDHLDELVVKLVDGSSGYGMLFGPTSSCDESDRVPDALPARYIAQPTLALSTPPLMSGQASVRAISTSALPS